MPEAVCRLQIEQIEIHHAMGQADDQDRVAVVVLLDHIFSRIAQRLLGGSNGEISGAECGDDE